MGRVQNSSVLKHMMHVTTTELLLQWFSVRTIGVMQRLALADDSRSGRCYENDLFLRAEKGQRVDILLSQLNASYFISKHYLHPQTL
jgi:hypothetical protein